MWHLNKMIFKKQKGVSLIITFFIMIIILAVVISISVLLYSQMKIIRNISNSIVSFYAAGSGVEKVLYYDRQVRGVVTSPPVSCDTDTPCDSGYACEDGFCVQLLNRGLCYMLDPRNLNKYCRQSLPIAPEYSIYCNTISNVAKMSVLNNDPTGCDISKCNNCQISFKSSFDDKDNKYYVVTAQVNTTNRIYINIKSNGNFVGTARQIETNSFLP